MKKLTVARMRDLEKQVLAGDISYSRMIERINEDLGHVKESDLFLLKQKFVSWFTGNETRVTEDVWNWFASFIEPLNVLPKGFPTHTQDINGKTICLGDIVDYDFEGDDPCPFEVIFEDNCFRKKYKKWDNILPKPELETGSHAVTMRLKIVK